MQSGSVGLSQKLSKAIDGASVVATSASGDAGRWTQMSISHARGLAEVLKASASTAAAVLTGPARTVPASRLDDREFVFVDLSSMNRILHHEPQDQVISVETGITLHELNAYLTPFGQWFPVSAQPQTSLLDLINRGDGGPLEHGFGAVRDLVLGLDAITGSGIEIKTGGIVVKNVTGYDTTKLIVGSHGTLALPYAAHLRLYARPEKTAAVIFHGASAQDLLLLAGDLIGADLSLVCCELLDLSIVRDSAVLSDGTAKLAQRWNKFGLIVRVAGHDELIKELIPQIRAFKREGTTNSELSFDDAEALLQICAAPAFPRLELSASVSEFSLLLADWLRAAPDQTFQYRVSTGRVLLYARDLTQLYELNDSLRSFLLRKSAPHTVAMAASELEYEIEYLGADIKKISQIKASLKERFDPSGCLNPLAVL
ncbi:MAG: FAD-binding oxidoreductase [Candidatus Obscuribacterales bacterium]